MSQPPYAQVPPDPYDPYIPPKTHPDQPPVYPTGGQAITSQPQAADGTTVIVTEAPYEERPSHGLSVGSLVFAIVTLILSCGGSFLCTVPAIILSSVALAQDHRVDRAKSLSIASLALTIAYWVCVIISIIIVVIVAVTVGLSAAEESLQPSSGSSSYDPF